MGTKKGDFIVDQAEMDLCYADSVKIGATLYCHVRKIFSAIFRAIFSAIFCAIFSAQKTNQDRYLVQNIVGYRVPFSLTLTKFVV